MVTPSEPSQFDLSLLAMDSEDLSIVSAHMQNAVVRVGEMIYIPSDQRFVLIGARYDWLSAQHNAPQRVRVGLHFDHVTRVTHIGVDQTQPQLALNLQSLLFKAVQAVAGDDEHITGHILLAFEGGSTIRLDVECIEAQMRDIGPRWVSMHEPSLGVDDRPPDVL
jgi:hypothetical protein